MSTSATSKIDLSRIKLRLENICKKVTNSISFEPSDVPVRLQDFYDGALVSCLEDVDSQYSLHPEDNTLKDEWAIYAYDESVRNYKALEGELLFCSSSVIKMDENYEFNLTVLPYFLTSINKFKDTSDDEIHFTENPNEARNKIIIENKVDAILRSTEPRSIVLIDGPIVGGNASAYIVKMDEELRKKNCIPLYFVKNSDSRLIIDHNLQLSNEFNSDLHWATHRLEKNMRSPLFRYTDSYNPKNSKVFTYLKSFNGFPQRVEMHFLTYEKYRLLIQPLMDLMAYFYVVQGYYSNPQVRPIAIAEKYAREGLRVMNIPSLLYRLGFHPTINQVRFG